MARTMTLDEMTMHFLLAGDDASIRELSGLSDILIGKKCPHCDSTNIWHGNDDEYACMDCEEQFNGREAFTEAFEDSGLGDKLARLMAPKKKRR